MDTKNRSAVLAMIVMIVIAVAALSEQSDAKHCAKCVSGNCLPGLPCSNVPAPDAAPVCPNNTPHHPDIKGFGHGVVRECDQPVRGEPVRNVLRAAHRHRESMLYDLRYDACERGCDCGANCQCTKASNCGCGGCK